MSVFQSNVMREDLETRLNKLAEDYFNIMVLVHMQAQRRQGDQCANTPQEEERKEGKEEGRRGEGRGKRREGDNGGRN